MTKQHFTNTNTDEQIGRSANQHFTRAV